MQIGEVAERTGLSLRTIRHYEEVGLVVPSARTSGGFRLYTEPDVDRLQLVKRMKPLGFQLEEMRELFELLKSQRSRTESGRPHEQRQLREFAALADQRCEDLRNRLHNAEQFVQLLHSHLDPEPASTPVPDAHRLG